MELLEYWKVVRKRLWLIFLLMISAGFTAAYVSEHQVPMYEATTTLFIDPSVSNRTSPAQLTLSADSLANTYSEFMKTRSFTEFVAAEMETPISESEIRRALSRKYTPGTQFFHIQAVHSDPRIAQQLANTAAEVLITQNIARQQARKKQIQDQMDSSKLVEMERLTEVQEVLQNELDYYNDQIINLQTQIAELQQAPPSEETAQTILELRGELVRFLTLRVEVLGNYAQTQVALATPTESEPDVDTLVVVDAAALPTAPLPFDTPERTMLAVAASLLLGIALAFVLEYLDYTVKTPEALDSIYGLPTQTVIGLVSGKSRRGKDQPSLVTMKDPRSPTAEAFRALRTGIQVAGLASPLRSLLVTSAKPAEGKTFVSANLAVSLAQNGTRVILVDTDLHKPELHLLFGLAREPGFTNLVFQPQVSISSFLQRTGIENLRVLTCGTIPPNPADLLGSSRAAEVMEQLEEFADIVIYDSPPAAAVTDALVIASRVDAVLQVVLAGDTRIELVRRCKAVLERVGARILGPVLNGVSRSDWGYQAYYGDYDVQPGTIQPTEKSAPQQL